MISNIQNETHDSLQGFPGGGLGVWVKLTAEEDLTRQISIQDTAYFIFASSIIYIWILMLL